MRKEYFELKKLISNGASVKEIDNKIIDIVLSDKKNMIYEQKIMKLILSFKKKCNDDIEFKKNIDSFVDSLIDSKNIKEVILKEIKNTKFRNIVSFRGQLLQRAAKASVLGKGAEWRLNDKIKALKFAQSLNVSIPHQKEVNDISTLSPFDPFVLKPIKAAGSRGVYIWNVKTGIRVKDGKSFERWSDFIADVKSNATNKWLIEEFIYRRKGSIIPAYDIKFYSFYGYIALILQVDRGKSVLYSWLDNELISVDTGKYSDRKFAAITIPEKMLEQAKLISKSIPAPFVRIDFLLGQDDFVLGEFTPRPGEFELFNDSIDYDLGRAYIEAEARLNHDMLSGKKFHDIFN